METPFTVNKDSIGKVIELGSLENHPDISKILGNVELSKVDQDGKLLNGVEFELYKIVQGKDEKVGDKYITDPNGKIIVKELELGNYKFVETKPLEGYEKLKEPVTFTIKGSELISLEVKNTKIKPEEPTKPEEPNKPEENNPTKPAENNKPEKPQNGNRPSKPVENHKPNNVTKEPSKNKPEKVSDEKLPKTGESDHLLNYILGIMLMGAGLFIRKRK